VSTSVISRLFTALRGLFYSVAFVAAWVWLAAYLQRFDAALGIRIPAWLRPFGWVLASTSAFLGFACIAAFLAIGRGTPAFFDPPRAFVAKGPYRYVRNPMYVGGFGMLFGAGFIVSSISIVLLAVGFFAVFHCFVVMYEEPALTRKFGDAYLKYCSSVSRWRIRRPARELHAARVG
jgi:protein-S-isoprenylcysteine O-methyltransferase Ste14